MLKHTDIHKSLTHAQQSVPGLLFISLRHTGYRLKSIHVNLVLPRFCTVSWSYFDEFKYFKYHSVCH